MPVLGYKRNVTPKGGLAIEESLFVPVAPAQARHSVVTETEGERGNSFDPYLRTGIPDSDLDELLLAQAISKTMATARGPHRDGPCDAGAASSSGSMAGLLVSQPSAVGPHNLPWVQCATLIFLDVCM